MSFQVYILYSKKLGQYYVGQTSDIEERLIRHNLGHGKHTRKGVPWILVWSIEVADRSEAMKLETKIKKRGAARFLKDLPS
ncbi:GIY-YIG nuclease family protein [Marivirga sp. S37H4]|uniref:GIY-YIG nuclease family protein n=1 Tax=Marivirga aurantiaca TaxID=2802615 RepID=A0A934WXL6_9BACT|nr:GIY-YIG nuclease family protein [Marivirga aurantiaca]MBK6264680.1 GIY-YIG nuclease family protein [Marivirga aurantiaca]